MEHFSNFDGLVYQRVDIIDANDLGISAEDEVIFQLRSGVEREAYETTELPLTCLTRALHDVSRDRTRRSQHLIAQRSVVITYASVNSRPFSCFSRPIDV
jgi:hypothetical protein